MRNHWLFQNTVYNLPEQSVIIDCWIDLTFPQKPVTDEFQSNTQKNVEAICYLFEVLLGGVCGGFSIRGLWAGPVLEVQEGCQLGGCQIFLPYLQLRLPSSFVPAQNCSWYASISIYMDFLVFRFWVSGKFGSLLIGMKSKGTHVINLGFGSLLMLVFRYGAAHLMWNPIQI